MATRSPETGDVGEVVVEIEEDRAREMGGFVLLPAAPGLPEVPPDVDDPKSRVPEAAAEILDLDERSPGTPDVRFQGMPLLSSRLAGAGSVPPVVPTTLAPA
jgi:hypothetical protein